MCFHTPNHARLRLTIHIILSRTQFDNDWLYCMVTEATCTGRINDAIDYDWRFQPVGGRTCR